MTTPFTRDGEVISSWSRRSRLADLRRQPRHGAGARPARAHARPRGIPRPDGGHRGGRQGPHPRDRPASSSIRPAMRSGAASWCRHERRGAPGDAGAYLFKPTEQAMSTTFRRMADETGMRSSSKRGALVVICRLRCSPAHERGSAGGRRQSRARRSKTVRRSHDDGADKLIYSAVMR